MKEKSDKQIIGIAESQYIFLTKKNLQHKSPLFRDLIDCIGVVIKLKNGDMICCHKFFGDNMQDFTEILRKHNLHEDNIKEILLLGGNITHKCYPTNETLVHKQRHLKIDSIEHVPDKNFSITTQVHNF